MSFYFAIGENPKGLRIGIVNDEDPNIRDCFNSSLVSTHVHDYSCDLRLISCRFLDEITQETGEKVYFKNYDEAYKSAKAGKVVAVVRLSSNYSQSLQQVLARHEYENEEIEDAELAAREIQIHMDQSNRQISFFLYRKMFNSYIAFNKKLMKDCNVSEKFMASPVHFAEPIYGVESDFKASMGPPMITLVIFFAASGLSLSIFSDRKEGFWNQTLLAGVELSEILVAYFLILSVFLVFHLVQTCLCLFYMTSYIFNFSLIIVYLVLLGYCGIWFGLALSFYFNDLTKLNLLFTTFGQIFMTLSGN